MSDDLSLFDLRKYLSHDEKFEFDILFSISQSHDGITSPKNHDKMLNLLNLASKRKKEKEVDTLLKDLKWKKEKNDEKK